MRKNRRHFIRPVAIGVPYLGALREKKISRFLSGSRRAYKIKNQAEEDRCSDLRCIGCGRAAKGEWLADTDAVL